MSSYEWHSIIPWKVEEIMLFITDEFLFFFLSASVKRLLIVFQSDRFGSLCKAFLFNVKILKFLKDGLKKKFHVLIRDYFLKSKTSQENGETLWLHFSPEQCICFSNFRTSHMKTLSLNLPDALQKWTLMKRLTKSMI